MPKNIKIKRCSCDHQAKLFSIEKMKRDEQKWKWFKNVEANWYLNDLVTQLISNEYFICLININGFLGYYFCIWKRNSVSLIEKYTNKLRVVGSNVWLFLLQETEWATWCGTWSTSVRIIWKRDLPSGVNLRPLFWRLRKFRVSAPLLTSSLVCNFAQFHSL